MSKRKKTSRPNRDRGQQVSKPIQPTRVQGTASHESKELEQASAFYEQILKQEPDNFDALYFIGILAYENQDYPRALEYLGRAAESRPDDAGTWFHLGLVLQAMKAFPLALECYNKAIAFKPDFAEAYGNCGVVLSALKEFPLALTCYDKAISLKPDFAYAYNNRGNVLQELGQLDAALQSCDRVIALKPDWAVGYNTRGIVLQKLERLDAALESYDKAIALDTAYTEAYNNRGFVLQRLQQLDAALESCDKAIALQADYAEAYNNRGIVLQVLKRFDDALQNYNKAIALKPDYAQPHFNKGLLDLLLGDFARGWPGYEWRWEDKTIGAFTEKREFDKPRWNGNEPLQGKAILLYAEQGLGDTIQFCRYAKLVAEKGAQVILEVQPALVTLLKGMEGVNQVIAQGDPLPAFDYHCPLLSLPLAFHTGLASIPQFQRYLKKDEAKVAAWSNRLGAQSRPRIGIVWSGSLTHKNDNNRSIALADFIHLLSGDYEFICLQKDIRGSDQAVLQAHPEIMDVSGELNDFTDTAALCELMDIIISVDTSVVHLAGALGKPTRVLLPVIPDWRWLLDRSDNPWYPSVKLYRQEQAGNWMDVLVKVKADLQTGVKGTGRVAN